MSRARDGPGGLAELLGRRCCRLRRVAAAFGMRADYGARGRDQPAGGVVLEGRAEVLDAAALRADARKKEDRARHEVAEPSQQVRPRGAGHGAYRRQARFAGVRLTELVHEAREPLVERVALRRVLYLRGARVRGADEDEAAGAVGRRRFYQRRERVPAEQWVGGEGVGAEPSLRPEWPRRLAHEPLRVGLRGDGHVAALAVG